ncbi:MAG: MBL fold metallo-hydrolase, partial [Polyangiaceae bacterium]
LDHIGAIAQHAARRALMKMPEGVYLVPAAVHEQVERLFNAAGELDGSPIARRVVPLEPGQDFELSAGRFVRPFATHHRVPSQGYCVYERRRRLLPEFQDRPGDELGRLRASGVRIDEPFQVAVLGFTGDTRIEVLETNPELAQVDTLVMEASFVDGRVSVEEARAMGHVHLDEVIARHDWFQNRELVLTHFSARYGARQVDEALQRLPDELRARTRQFGRE